MTTLFADITLGAVIVIGLLMIGGVMLVANLNDPRNAKHPDGRAGRFRDECLSVAPVLPFLAMILTGAFFPDLRDAVWWLPVLTVVAIGGAAASFVLAPVKRARKRVEDLRKGTFS